MAVPPLDDLYTALKAVIAAVWPEVEPNGVFEVEHLAFLPFADLTPPYAYIRVQSLPRNSEYGPVNAWCYLPAVEIGYVAEVSGPSSGIREKLEALRDSLGAHELSAGQVMDAPEIDWSDDLEMNRELTNRTLPQRAGVITSNILIGGSPL